jgi:hypothetical protein
MNHFVRPCPRLGTDRSGFAYRCTRDVGHAGPCYNGLAGAWWNAHLVWADPVPFVAPGPPGNLDPQTPEVEAWLAAWSRR